MALFFYRKGYILRLILSQGHNTFGLIFFILDWVQANIPKFTFRDTNNHLTSYLLRSHPILRVQVCSCSLVWSYLSFLMGFMGDSFSWGLRLMWSLTRLRPKIWHSTTINYESYFFPFEGILMDLLKHS